VFAYTALCVVCSSRVVTSPMTYLQTTRPTALLPGSRRRRSTLKWTFPSPRPQQPTGVRHHTVSMNMHARLWASFIRNSSRGGPNVYYFRHCSKCFANSICHYASCHMMAEYRVSFMWCTVDSCRNRTKSIGHDNVALENVQTYETICCHYRQAVYSATVSQSLLCCIVSL